MRCEREDPASGSKSLSGESHPDPCRSLIRLIDPGIPAAAWQFHKRRSANFAPCCGYGGQPLRHTSERRPAIAPLFPTRFPIGAVRVGSRPKLSGFSERTLCEITRTRSQEGRLLAHSGSCALVGSGGKSRRSLFSGMSHGKQKHFQSCVSAGAQPHTFPNFPPILNSAEYKWLSVQ
jgi:hypothetical protein